MSCINSALTPARFATACAAIFCRSATRPPTAIRERRRTLRYRNLLVRQMVQMKHKIGMLLMKAGASYNKQRLHNAGYFRELLATNPDIDEGLRVLLRQCRETMERLSKTEGAVLRVLIVVHQIQIEDRDVALPA
jgi:transposase